MHNRIGHRFQRRLDVPVWLERGPQGDINAYDNKVLGYSPDIFYPVDEAAGAIALDASGNSFDGTYSNVVLAQEGIGDGKTSGLWVPASNPILFTPDISGVFDGDEFSLMVWVKARVAAVWDVDNLNFVNWRVDANNLVDMRVHPVNGDYGIARLAGGGAFRQANGATGSPVVWTCLIVTCSLAGTAFFVYQDGVQIGTAVVGDAFVGAEDRINFGNNAGLTTDWDGNMAKAAVWFGTVLTQPQAADLAIVI